MLTGGEQSQWKAEDGGDIEEVRALSCELRISLSLSLAVCGREIREYRWEVLGSNSDLCVCVCVCIVCVNVTGSE